MSKSKDILQQKASSVQPLKSAIGNTPDETGEDQNTLKPTTIINDEGKKVLVFKDPLYSREKRSTVNYTIFRGKWDFENLDGHGENEEEKFAVKFVPQSEGAEFTIAFKSLKDRVEFMDSIYSDREMRQVGSGMRLENLANSKVLKTTGGLLGLSIAGYGLYKFFGKKNDGDK